MTGYDLSLARSHSFALALISSSRSLSRTSSPLTLRLVQMKDAERKLVEASKSAAAKEEKEKKATAEQAVHGDMMHAPLAIMPPPGMMAAPGFAPPMAGGFAPPPGGFAPMGAPGYPPAGFPPAGFPPAGYPPQGF